MTPRNDNLDGLRAAMDNDLARLCVALGMRPDGNRFFCPHCQADGGKDGDFSVDAGLKCHKCGWSGDGLELVRAVRGCDFPAAVQFARDVYGATDTAPKTKTRKGGKVHPDIDAAARAALWSVGQRTGKEHTETRRDLYKTADGVLVAAVLRFDPVEGDGKTFVPVHSVKDGWKVGDPPGLWPLFGLPEIVGNPEATVFIVEGEKAATAGASIGLLTTTSAHGSKSPAKTDWSPLAGRDVILLPDNDDAGRAYADAVARILEGLQ